MKKGKLVALVFAGFLFTFLASSYLALTTPMLSAFILRQARAQAARRGVTLEFASGQLIPARGLRFKNFKVQVGVNVIQAEELRADYTLHFLPLELDVHFLKIAGGAVQFEKQGVAASASEGSPPSFPLTLRFEKIEVRGLKTNIEAAGFRESGVWNMDMSSSLTPKALVAQGNFTVKTAVRDAGGQGVDLTGSAVWDVDADLAPLKLRKHSLKTEFAAVDLRYQTLRAATAEIKAASNDEKFEAEIRLKGKALATLNASVQPKIMGHLSLTLLPEVLALVPALGGNQGKVIENDFTVEDLNTAHLESRASALVLPAAGRTNLKLTQDLKRGENLVSDLGELSLRNVAYGAWKIDFALKHEKETRVNLNFAREKAGSFSPLSFNEPIKVQARSERGGGLSVIFALPESRFRDKLRLSPVNGELKYVNQKLEIKIDEGPLEYPPNPELKIHGLKFQAHGAVTDQLLTIEQMQLSLADHLFEADGQATYNFKTKDAQTELKLNSQVENLAGISGGIEAPLTLTVSRGKEIALDGQVRFNSLRAKVGPLTLDKLDGAIPVHERFKLNGAGIEFTQLLSENPFERVDFNRVRPLLGGKRQLRVESVQWKEKTYGPWNGFVSLEQNMLSAHAFDLDLGQGKAYGELFFNFYPKNLQFGFLGRLTELNLTEFLPKEFLKGQDVKSRDLSARVGLICNLNRSALEGRVDVTEIGGRQLMALMNVLDPDYSDDKFNKIRNMLQIGYPVALNSSFIDGFMDMTVDLNILGLIKRENVHGVPLSEFVSRATHGLVENAQKGFIQ